jgi:tetrapyrrole methylase family protein / MazG family protein
MAPTRAKLTKRKNSKTGALRPTASKRTGTDRNAISGKSVDAKALVPPRTAEWFEKLAAVQARLRAPKGCPWDREQTHQSLRTYLIEEAYEVLEAMESGDDKKFADELGDLLLQVLFHADIARENGRFDVVDVIRAIHDKMIRRHPHVFGDVNVKNSAEVLRNWDRIKAQERRAAAQVADGSSAASAEDSKTAASLLDGVTRGLPATLEGFQLTRKASRIGFDWDDAEGVLEKVREESAELQKALAAENRARLEEEMGDLLFAAVNLARFLKIDPEIALKRANGKFSSRFRAMEAMAREGGRELASVPRDEMEKFWDIAKQREKPGSSYAKSAADLAGVLGSAGVPPPTFSTPSRQPADETAALVGKRPGRRRAANP